MDKNLQEINNTYYGVTEKGFRRKLFPECVADRIERAKKVFGVNIDTSETSFLGKLIRNVSWDEAYLWELAEDVYNAPFVNTAEGTALDNVGMYLTITRRPATKAKAALTIYGVNETVVPKGFLVSTKNNVIFETMEEVIIKDGKTKVEVQSIEAGKSSNVDLGTITEIVNPTIGVERVVNEKEAVGGLDIESDREFRERYKKSYSRVGGSTVLAITAALLDIDKVVDCEVRENVTMEERDGIPPKSFACYVYGGEDEEIALAIYQNKSAGIQAYGETVIDVTDEKDQVHKIGFTRAKVQYIWVKIKAKKDKEFKGEDAIKRALINYIGGHDESGIEYTGLKLGEDVIYSKSLGKLMCMGGFEDVEILLSSDGQNYSKSNIEIARNTIARTDPQKVVIEYV